MWKFLGVDKALQCIQADLVNSTSKLTDIGKHIKKDSKRLKEVKDYPTYSEEQRQLYRDKIDELKTEQKLRLEILSQAPKKFQTQVTRIKQIIEKDLNKNQSSAEGIRTFFREQGTTVVSIFTTIFMSISTIFLAITGVFGGGGGLASSGSSPSKDEEALKMWLSKLVDVLKRFAGKTVEALSNIAQSVVGAIFSFFGKGVG